MQEPQPLGRHLVGEKIDAGRVAAGPGEAGDKTKLDRVFADAEDDRDRRGCSFGRERSGHAAGRGDHGHLSADQIGHQCRQAIVLALQPVVLDRHVLAFDVAGFVEAFAERGRMRAEASGDPPLINPTTGIAGCCARAASGQATAAPPSAEMNCRLPMSIAI